MHLCACMYVSKCLLLVLTQHVHVLIQTCICVCMHVSTRARVWAPRSCARGGEVGGKDLILCWYLVFTSSRHEV